MSKTTENIIVVIIMVAVIIGLLCFVGYDNIKEWLSTPFVWKEPDFLTIEYAGTMEKADKEYLLFEVYNRSEKKIHGYSFHVLTGDRIIRFDSLDASEVRDGRILNTGDIEANGFTTLAVSCNQWDMPEDLYAFFNNMSLGEQENINYRVVELEEHSDTIFSNNGWIKIITILVASLVLGLLGFVNKFPVWARIILKTCGLPIVLCLAILYLFSKGSPDTSNNTDTGTTTNDSQYREAQQRYNRAANLKAGAVSTGNRHSAAKAQEQMDKAMADMIMANGSGSSSARDAAARYRREANLKAGATITGRAGDAARAQANMDKALADMIKNK